jgi:hypothetical protein
MKLANPWTTYRTRFLVNAKQLHSSLTFTDSLGRHHSGRKGDYLVESSDGVLRIAPRQIFEDIYVPLLDSENQNAERLGVEKQFAEPSRPSPTFSLLSPLTRKSPQPYRDRRNSSPGLRSL